MLKVGLTLLVMGIGTVFSFLIILIFTMIITYKVLQVVNRFFPEVVVEAAPAKKPQTSDDAEIAIAIASVQRL